MSSMYTIGLRLVAHNNAGPQLLNLAAQLMHVHEVANRTNMALGRFRTALAGMAGVFVGTELIKGAVGLVDHGAELLHIQNQMTTQGATQADQAAAIAKAWEVTAKYKNISVTESLEMQKEMGFVLGSLPHATELAMEMAKMQTNLEGALGVDSGAAMTGQVMAAIRAAEMSGNSMSHVRMDKYLDQMSRIIIGTGGTVKPSDILMATQYGRASAISWSDDFTSYVLPTLTQQLGGSKVGTGFMSMWQAVVGGHMLKSAIPEWQKLGLLDPKLADDRNVTPEGRFKHWDAHAMKGLEQFKSDPDQWAASVLIPAMIQHGVISKAGWEEIQKGNIKEGLGADTRSKIVDELTALFSNRTANSIADALTLETYKIQRDIEKLKQTQTGGAAADTMLEKDWEMNKKALSKQWDDFMTSLGSPAVANAVTGLKAINDAIGEMAQAFAKHPGLGRAFVGIGMTVGGLLAGGGLLALASLVPGGPIIVGLGLLAAGVTALGAVKWDGIKNFFGAIKDWIVGTPEQMDKNGGMHSRQKGFIDNVKSMWNSIVNFRVTPDMLGGFVTSIGTAFTNAMSAAWKKASSAIWDLGSKLGQAIHDAIANAASMIGGFFSGSTGNGPVGARGSGGGGPTMPMGGPGFLQKQGYVPEGGSRPVVIHTALHLDGRQIAEQVTMHQARSAIYVGSAATFDGMMHPGPVDQSYA